MFWDVTGSFYGRDARSVDGTLFYETFFLRNNLSRKKLMHFCSLLWTQQGKMHFSFLPPDAAVWLSLSSSRGRSKMDFFRNFRYKNPWTREQNLFFFFLGKQIFVTLSFPCSKRTFLLFCSPKIR